ncbi:orotate phosphoribosyltransferase [Desulfitispora alkaliphila]|uniref:orotate phosphoribosyltransferase n=1 Tax=Desulfitispora alkaliphila TaxID=622674 RepID=UPI003D23E8FA
MDREEVLNILKESGALLTGHFLLTSGKHSDKYIQCAQVLKYPEYTERLVAGVVKQLKGNYDLVVGPAIGGIIVAYEFARQLKVPALFTERENGEMALRRGFEIPEGANTLVVEDVITTGGSVKEVIDIVRANGAVVNDVAVLVDRSAGKAKFDGANLTSLLQTNIQTYETDKCPLCKGDVSIIKPGSRSKK